MAKKEITVALAGNPNSGKTTLFNSLTGASQHVGNWPGVTVEKKEGSCSYQGYRLRVVDLPGVYSLTAYSLDEVVARNFVVDEKPDVVVDIVDATNLERNLYLTVQLLEMEANLVVALNMMDMAESRRYQIDTDELSHLLEVPVVPMVATRKYGNAELLREIVNVFEERAAGKKVAVYYGSELEEHIAELSAIIAQDDQLSSKFSPRWLAIKLLEEDGEVLQKIEGKT
ncbi:FeoB small GTPase domain-containing protein [Chloroflexota bacterium]